MSEGSASDSVNYRVNAWLTTRGSFGNQIAEQTRNVSQLEKRWRSFASNVSRSGAVMAGATGTIAKNMLMISGALAVASATMGFRKLVSEGLEFNAELDKIKMSLAAIYQLYGQNGGDLKKNIQQAAMAQRELFDMAKKSPVTFKDAAQIYQGASAGLIVAGRTFKEQMDFMKGANMLGAVIPDLDAKTIGGQLGRTLLGGAGAEFEVWNRLAPKILEIGKAQKIFNKNLVLGGDMALAYNKFAKANPEKAAALLEEALEPMKKMADEFARSWGGIISATNSNLQVLASTFTKPFYEMRKRVLYALNNAGDGLFSDANIGKIEHIATVMGMFFSDASERAYNKLIKWITLLRDNWEAITQKIYETGQAVALAIKGAFMIGAARFVGGTALRGAGATMTMGANAVVKGKEWGAAIGRGFSEYQRGAFRRMARGALDQPGQGLTGMVGRGVRRAGEWVNSRTPMMAATLGMAGNSTAANLGDKLLRFLTPKSSGLGRTTKIGGQGGMLDKLGGILTSGKFSKNVLPFFLRMTSFVAVAAAGAVAVGILVAGLAMFVVIAAGIGVYLVSQWRQIATSIRDGLNSGSVSLRPFLVAMFTLVEKLKVVGKVFVGGGDGASMFTGMMKWMIEAMNLGGDAVSMTMKIIGVSLGVWGALKLAFQGVMAAVIKLMELMNLFGMVEDASVANAKKNYEEFAKGVQDTFTNVDQLLAKADQIAKIDISSLDMDEINRKADEWKKKITEGIDQQLKDTKKPPSAVVNVKEVNVNVDARDEDPDRVMAMIVKPLQDLGGRRVQAYDMTEAPA